MDEIWVSCLLLSVLFDASVLSAFYLVFVYWLVFGLILQDKNPRYPYVGTLVYSVLVTLTKLILVIVIISGCCDSYLRDLASLQKFVGIYVKRGDTNWEDYFNTFFNDLLVYIISLLGLCLARRETQRFQNPRKFVFIGVLTALVTSLFKNTIMNQITLLLSLASIVIWGYKIPIEPHKLIMKLVSICAVVQFTLSYIFTMIYTNISKEKFAEIGLINQDSALMLDFIGALIRVTICLFFARPTESDRSVSSLIEESIEEPLPNFRVTAQELRERLMFTYSIQDESREDSIPLPSFYDENHSLLSRINSKIPFALMFFIARIMLFFWIISYQSFFTLVFILWLFYTILDNNTHRIVQSTAFVLVPMLVINLLIFYNTILTNSVDNIYYTESSEIFRALSVPWKVLMILLFIFSIYKFVVDFDSEPDTEISAFKVVYIIFMQNTDKAVLFILFIIGLYEINVIHSIFLVINLTLMMNSSAAKEGWLVLILYTQAVLFVRYLCYELMFYIDDMDQYNQMYKLIGLPLPKKDVDYVWRNEVMYDSFLWAMLFFESLQLKVYRTYANYSNVDPAAVVDRWKKTTKLLTDLYSFYIYYEIWVVYILLYLIMSLSLQNILNAVRFSMYLGYIVLHVFSAELNEGLKKVIRSWWIITYYSGVLMSARYLYQFKHFFSPHEDQVMRVLGITIYQTKDLYASMISDCLQLVLTVLTLKSLNEHDNIHTYYRSVEGLDDLGLLRQIIYLQKSRDEHKAPTFIYFFKSLSNGFDICIYALIFLLSVVWKLSVSMVVLNLIICIFLVLAGNKFCFNVLRTKIPKRKSELKFRYKYWYFTMILVVVYNCLEYWSFLFHFHFLTFGKQEDVEWWNYFIGFEKGHEGYLLRRSYGYALILFILIMERQCIEHLNRSKDKLTYQPRAKTFTRSLLNFCRILTESITPSSMLLLALVKLTFVSIIYVLAVLLGIWLIKSRVKRAKFFNYIIISMIIVQYSLILSNISNQIAPNQTDIDCPVDIPWYLSFTHISEDQLTFLNLGTTYAQFQSLSLDMLFALLNHIYIRYLILSLLPKIPEPKEVIAARKRLTGVRFARSLRFVIYRIADITLLVLILLLYGRQSGVLAFMSLILILACVYKCNDGLKSTVEKNFNYKATSYMILPFMSLIFFIEILYQLPFDRLHPDNEHNWMYALGIYQLWRADEKTTPDHLHHNLFEVYIKILLFFLVYLLYLLSHDDTFRKYTHKKKASDKLWAMSIGLELAQSFNNRRILKHEKMKTRSQKLQNELKNLDKMVSKWSDKFHRLSESRYTLQRQTLFRPTKATPKRPTRNTFTGEVLAPQQVEKSKSKIWLQRFLMKHIDPVFYRRVFNKLKQREKREEREKLELVVMEEIKEAEESEAQSEVNEQEDMLDKELKQWEEGKEEEEEDELKFLKDKKEGEEAVKLTFREYLSISFYALFSSSEFLAYLSFFVNHFVYASLESVVFPISVLGYALLENPRPPARYWKVMLLYSEAVIFIKLLLTSNLWITVFGEDYMKDYKDPAKIGFNRPDNTYSGNIFSYIVWDIVCIFMILRHEYNLVCLGLWPYSEYDLESIHEAKIRLEFENQNPVFRVRSASFDSDLDCINPSPISKIKKFLMRLLPRQPEEKPGKDYYLTILMIQFIILVFLLCFYTKMDGEYREISSAFAASTFSGYMVIAVACHIIIMMLDKYFYLSRSSSAFSKIVESANSEVELCRGIKWDMSTILKLIMHMTLLVLIHILVFWYYPIHSNNNLNNKSTCDDIYDENHCNNYQINWSLQLFYFIYFWYFYMNAIQLRDGMPLFRKGALKIMQNYSGYNNILYRIYRFLPFLFELRTLSDWCFTSTSLTIFQWFKLDDLYGRLFLRKIVHEKMKNRVPGTPNKWSVKFFMGFCFIFFILLVILLPLFLFSSLDPFMNSNPVKNVKLSIGVAIDNNYFELYESAHTLYIKDVSQDEWEKLDIKDFNGVSNADRENAQLVYMPISSDNVWTLNPDSQTVLCQRVTQSFLNDLQNIVLRIQIEIDRHAPPHKTSISQTRELPVTDMDSIERLKNVTCIAVPDTPYNYFNISNYYPQMIKMASVGNNPAVRSYDITHNESSIFLRKLYSKEYHLYYWSAFQYKEHKDPSNANRVCPGDRSTVNEDCNIDYLIISDKYSPATFNFSAITFYFSVVYLIARLIRTATSNASINLVMSEIENPDYLINLCEGIYVSRMTGDLVREEVLYYELMDIFRSPELIKMVTGSSSVKNKVKTD